MNERRVQHGYELVTLNGRGRWHLVAFLYWAGRSYPPAWQGDTTLCGKPKPWTRVYSQRSAQICHACERGLEHGFDNAPAALLAGE